MLHLLKKLLILAAGLAIALFLMWVAFYLFLIGLVFALGITLYVKWKGLHVRDMQGKHPHYWWMRHKSQGKTVIIEGAEYREVKERE